MPAREEAAVVVLFKEKPSIRAKEVEELTVTHEPGKRRVERAPLVPRANLVCEQNCNVERPRRVRRPFPPPFPPAPSARLRCSEHGDAVVEAEDYEQFGQARAVQDGEKGDAEKGAERCSGVSCAFRVEVRRGRVLRGREAAGEKAEGVREGKVEEHEEHEEGEFRAEEVVLRVGDVLCVR